MAVVVLVVFVIAVAFAFAFVFVVAAGCRHCLKCVRYLRLAGMLLSSGLEINR